MVEYNGEVVFCSCGRWKYENEVKVCTKSPKCELCERTRNEDGTIKLRNPHISQMPSDFLYHIALGTATHDLVEMFSDVKFVCMGGSAHRMENFAHYIMKEIGYKIPSGTTLKDLSYTSHRFCFYKIGPVISVNHGMGFSSVTILLHEMIKLMYHAKCKDPIFIRIGSSGGVGIEPGTVVVSNGGVDARLRDCYDIPVIGNIVSRPARTDQQLAEEIRSVARPDDAFKVVVGKTMAASDFYEEQGRIDGAFCEITEADKMAFLGRLSDGGVKNIEMESLPFFAYTHHAGIKAADVCVALVNRLKGDQVDTPKEKLSEYENFPQQIVSRFIKKRLAYTK